MLFEVDEYKAYMCSHFPTHSACEWEKEKFDVSFMCIK